MQLVNAPSPHPLREDAHGVIRIGQTRVTLESIVALFEQGASAEEIALRYEALTLGEVYAALSFYMAYPDDVDAYLRSQRRASDQARVHAEQRSPFTELRRRLLARKSA